MGDGLLALNWDNHGTAFRQALATLRQEDKYTDVTVSCEGKFYHAHKLVLSTCSEYFEKVFESTPCHKHPVIVLQDVQCSELEALLNYMYKGAMSVVQSDLSRLIKIAEHLQIKGLAIPDESPSPGKSDPSKRTSHDSSQFSNTDSISPSPKRRKGKDSDSIKPNSSSETLTANQCDRDSQETKWLENQDTCFTDDRLRDTTQDVLQPTIMVNVDETSIKEEVLSDDSVGLNEKTGIPNIHEVSTSSQDGGGLFIPKFDESSPSIDSKPFSAVEADPIGDPIVGPSGLQGMADGGDFPGSMAFGDSFSVGESHDMPSSVGLPLHRFSDSQQMVMDDTNGFHHGLKVLGMGAPKRHQCPHCDYSTDRRSSMTDHMRSHTKEKPFACSYCSFRSAVKSNLAQHIRRHTGEKPYGCPFCSSRFAQKNTLNDHIRTHTGEKPNGCHLCPYRTIHRSNLKTHLFKKHGFEME